MAPRAPRTSAESQHYIDTGRRPAAASATIGGMPKNFVLRDVPDQVWAAFEARSRLEGWPNARAILVRLVEDYATEKTNPSEPPPKG